MPDHAEPAPQDPALPEIDPTVPQTGNNHGEADGYSGQEPGTYDSPIPATVDVGAVRGGMPAARGAGAGAGAGAGQNAADLPPEAGHRATVDQRTGEVHGSGAGAGGGRAGEDLDDSTGGTNTDGDTRRR